MTRDEYKEEIQKFEDHVKAINDDPYFQDREKIEAMVDLINSMDIIRRNYQIK